MRRSLLGLLFLPLCAMRGGQVTAPLQQTWLQLETTTNRCADVFDYHPQGGMRSFWCHVQDNVDLMALELEAGVPIWLGGPHSSDRGPVWVRDDFGRYNPEFVRWLVDHAIPRDEGFRDETQSQYDRFVRPLARTHHAVLRKLREQPGCASRELDLYAKAISGGTSDTSGEWGPHYENWYGFLEPGFCGRQDRHQPDGDYNGNVVKTAVGFWMRRYLDGTDKEFERGLVKLLDTYDSKWKVRERRR